jgi:hypothetical protein
MNVWARFYSVIGPEEACEQIDFSPSLHLKLSSYLHIILFSTEHAARESQDKYGGVVLLIDAASLRGQVNAPVGDEQYVSLDSVGDNGDSPLGDPSCISKTVGVAAYYGNLPHRKIESDEEHSVKFKDRTWLDQLEAELGVYVQLE